MTGRPDEVPEDLTEDQIADLKSRLAELREEVRGQLEGAVEEARPVDLGLSIGRLTRMDALQQQQMATARKTRLETQLRQIQSAERRLTDGTYGECLRCELPIGYARLSARPEATLCTRCQSAG